MKFFGWNAYAGVACFATIGIAGCAGTQQPPVMPNAMPVAHALTKQRFPFTGYEQSFTVPTGVTQLTVVASGASGPSSKYSTGGRGGKIRATIPVTPGETLAVFVGGEGALGAYGSGGSGGFNGGGAGGASYVYAVGGDGGDGGGGASDVRQGGDALS
ncbi:MAG: glycine-rich protein, partial [Candidatus Cybelea sp.]